MKLAILTKNFSRSGGGAESYAVHLALAMQAECDITVVAYDFAENHAGLRYIRVPKFPIRSRWMQALWFNWKSARLTRSGFDIVHSHENVTHAHVNTVHVKTVHVSLQQKKTHPLQWLTSPRLLAYLWLERRRLCNPEHGNVFVSQQLLDETRERLPPLGPSEFIAPGVHLPLHRPTPEQIAAARQALGIASGTLVVGFVGHDLKKKGLGTLLRALRQVTQPVCLLVIGNATGKQLYSAELQALDKQHDVRFLGVVADMPTAYIAMDCLAHPTTQDVFPMVLLEAMAHHVPVITTAAPYNSMADLLSDGHNACVIENPQADQACAQALQRLGADAAFREQVATGGRRFAQAYDWQTVKQRYYTLFKALS